MVLPGRWASCVEDEVKTCFSSIVCIFCASLAVIAFCMLVFEMVSSLACWASLPLYMHTHSHVCIYIYTYSMYICVCACQIERRILWALCGPMRFCFHFSMGFFATRYP